MNYASITGIGTWLPERVRRNDEWPEAFVAGEHLKGERTFNDIPAPADAKAAAILARDLAAEAQDPFLGVEQRHVADEAMTCPEAEARAARVALSLAGVSAEQVNVLMSNAAVPDRVGPNNAADIAGRIGATRALCIQVDTGCASSVTQLELARAYIEAGMAETIVLTQSHLMLRVMPMNHPASPGLGDSASALVVQRAKPGLAIRSTFGVTHPEFATAVIFRRGSDPESDRPWFRGGEDDFRLGTLEPVRVKQLLRDTVEFGAATVREAVRRAGVDVESVQVLASVQPRGFLPGGIAERLGLSRDRAVTTYHRVGHLGACGPVFNLAEARDRGRLRPGAIVAVYGQGIGFTRTAVILEVV